METFVVNETSEDVWFDNMMLMSMSSPIAQETHYDPWGLELTGIGFQYGGIKANKYLYNGKELNEDAGLQYYDYGARMYDPVIGRWGVIDPLSDMYQEYAPYNYVVNNPINNYDPDGRIVGTLIGGIIGAVGGATNAYIKGEDVFAGAVEGATAGIVAGAIVDITVATGGTGLVVIGAGIAGGALGAASGDVTGQVTENLRGGDNINAALSNVNFEKTGEKALSGALAGGIGGTAGVALGKGLQAAANSTKTIQATMSKNITETAKNLTQSGAGQKVVENAVNKITTGMGEVGRNTANNSAKISAAATTGTEVFFQISQIIEKK
ncbi:RHS repeat-associated core domain-containing protein [Algoriphagus boritolerans DSM 17298 = JCM 18970]|uniref:RHS repeat-associated core domain-containing protein n=2 Tax=Algoriphagus TaxID=246875 RepID=A0A1H6ARJ4_9BACT|nr:RHS repeat-associated core domain-containing protein [Algoriphagus boritolerans DSM 17298 = JCM 18970]